MPKKKIIAAFKLMVSLLELHAENTFKTNGYRRAAGLLENAPALADRTSPETLATLGLSKSMAEKAAAIAATGTFPELEALRRTTPPGLLDMMKIRGVGAKKIRVLWQELGIDNLEALEEACRQNQVSALKGFAEKTQNLMLGQIAFLRSCAGKMLIPEAERAAETLKKYLESHSDTRRVAIAGELRRCRETVAELSLLVSSRQNEATRRHLDAMPELKANPRHSGPKTWRGHFGEAAWPLHVRFVKEEEFVSRLFLASAEAEHLAAPIDETGKTLRQLALRQDFPSETALYEAAGMDCVAPEMQEGRFALTAAGERRLPRLVEPEDLKGILHNHSTYSDGAHSLEAMACHCRDLGYEYLGISDHSRSAHYAGGLSVADIERQHEEIDRLNEKMAPFRIFKGIESDILQDGSLDYEEEVLRTFDFIVASVHAQLNMDRETATQRLIRAIENPHTTILGHPTGRLLLRRQGYPLDFSAVIEACAAHGVSIEINANPRRLDMDWRHVAEALDKGLLIGINPDAHEKAGYADMRYGLMVGRKAGLSAEKTLNSLSAEEISRHFWKRKERAKKIGSK